MFVHRPIVMTRRGVVVAGHHAAADAGAQVLREGGNAMDAAVAAAATLAVAIPHMNGAGGDSFALWFGRAGGEAVVINGSGGAPARATLEEYRRRGLSTVPARGPLSISVPGAPHAWAEALRRFGTMPLEAALRPAIALAEEGLPVDRGLRDFLNGPVYAALCCDFPALARLFGPPGGRRLGEALRQPALARSLRAIAREGVDALYGGAVGGLLAREAAAAGALLTPEDLAAHRTLLQPPLESEYRGHTVLAAPPNTQGIALLLILALLSRDPRPGESFPARLLRAKLAAFAVRDRFVGDPEAGGDLRAYLSPEGMAALLAEAADGEPRLPGRSVAGEPAGGDTTTVVVMDAEGNAVSWVQSLFDEFGSGVVSEGTGIVLQNRLHLASLTPGGPNSLAPGRRPFHTLCPALLVREGVCRLAIATPGDHGQPQTLAQVIVNLLDRAMDVQEAIEAPRIRHDRGPEVMYEGRIEPGELHELAAHGYSVRDVGAWSRLMGGVNAIHSPDGSLKMGGADPRRSCYAVAQ